MSRIKAILLTLFFVFVSIFVAFELLNINQDSQIKLSKEMILKEARSQFKSIVNTRSWNSQFGGVYVKSDNLKPNKYLLNNHIFTKNNEMLIKINPAWMTKQISEIANSKGDYYFKITSLKPNNPDNSPDKFEKKALELFEKNRIDEYYEFNHSMSKFNYIGALKVENSCLTCHTTQGYKEGDFIGGIRVSLPTKELQNFQLELKNNHNILKTILICISIFITLILIWFINSIYNRQETIESISLKNEELTQRYKLAIDGANDGLWDWNLETNEIFFSRRWKEMLGFNVDELENRLETWAKLVHPDDLEKATRDIEKNQNKQTDYYENIHRLKHKDGHYVWILDRGKTIFNEAGKAIRMVGFHTDISKQKNLELSLNESQKNLLKSQEIAKIAFWKLNLKSMNLTTSENINNIFGLDKNIEFGAKELFLKFVCKDDRKRVTKTLIENVKAKNDYSLTYKFKKLDDEKLYYINCNVELEIINNKVENVLGTIQDITNIQNIEDELTILRTAIENAPITFVVTNLNGEIEYVNKAFSKTTGYTYEEAIGQNPRILKSDFTDNYEYEELWKTIAEGKTWSGTFKNKNKFGEEFWELAFISPIFSNSGEIIKYLAIKQEITKEVYLKQELKNKEELMISQSRHAAMGEMISMIAHQWRQPIAVIAMGTNNILADLELESLNEDRLKEILDDIITQTEYLSQTIDDFKNFFKPDKEKEFIYIQSVFKESLNVIGKVLENNDIVVKENYSSNHQIKTFPKELLQVFINIIKNAKEVLVENREFNREISINEFEQSNFIIIEISDNGGGINETIIDKIFDPYFTTKDELGTGLGLYMSKTIIEKHLNGKISAFNTDDGACFQIKFSIKDSSCLI